MIDTWDWRPSSVCVCVCLGMTKLILRAEMLKCLGFGRPQTTGCCSVTSPSRIYLPAAPHRAKVITIQHGPSAGSIRCQAYQNTTCTFSSALLRDSSIRRLASSLLSVHQQTQRKNIFSSVQHTQSETVITLQSFHPKYIKISSQLCHLRQETVIE